MTREKINYPEAEGITPETEEARQRGLLESADETMEMMDLKAEGELRRHDEEPAKKPDGKEEPDFEPRRSIRPGLTDEKPPSQPDAPVRETAQSPGSEEETSDPVVEINRIITKHERLKDENDLLQQKIFGLINQHNVSSVFENQRTSLQVIQNQLDIARRDPGVQNAAEAKKQAQYIFSLEKVRALNLNKFKKKILRTIGHER
ncbi:hypothetical protein KJ705_05350 [Patescibacteria group bacterium]|nr:hypothetical protein [Patescibacteria group bacterium]